MSDRNLSTWTERSENVGLEWTLEVERSAAGQPRLQFTASDASGSITVFVDDGKAFLAPVIEWLNGNGR